MNGIVTCLTTAHSTFGDFFIISSWIFTILKVKIVSNNRPKFSYYKVGRIEYEVKHIKTRQDIRRVLSKLYNYMGVN